MQLFEFGVDVGSGGGIADVGVDLAEKGGTDAHRLQVAMVDVGRDDGAAAGDFIADQFGC